MRSVITSFGRHGLQSKTIWKLKLDYFLTIFHKSCNRKWLHCVASSLQWAFGYELDFMGYIIMRASRSMCTFYLFLLELLLFFFSFCSFLCISFAFLFHSDSSWHVRSRIMKREKRRCARDCSQNAGGYRCCGQRHLPCELNRSEAKRGEEWRRTKRLSTSTLQMKYFFLLLNSSLLSSKFKCNRLQANYYGC